MARWLLAVADYSPAMTLPVLVRLGLILIGLTLAGISGCTTADRATQEVEGDQTSGQAGDRFGGQVNGQASDQIIRGYAGFGHEVRSFRPCNANTDLWAVDRSGLLWDLHKEMVPTQDQYAELFAVVKGTVGPAPSEGFGNDYAGELVVTEVHYVAREGFGCEADWSRFSWRAQGNEPFWAVEIGSAGMSLMQPDAPRTVWTEVKASHTDRGWIFTAADEGSPPARLTITRTPCRDTMSGAYFAFSATLLVGSKEMNGCAVAGDAASRP
jgi:putative lipoprotein